MSEKVKVVFLAGMGRSGSTLLDRLLGQLPGWWSLGEVVHLWSRGGRDNERCGCGRPFHSCPTWQSIGAAAFGGWDRFDFASLETLRSSVERDRYLPLLARPSLSPSFRERLDRYNSTLANLYRGASEATRSPVIVDSGKHVSAALALRSNRDIDLRVVHLVRDSRGVAYSWTKSVPRPATGGATTMKQWSPLESAVRYLSYNAVLGAAFGSRRHFLRYEDLVADPDLVIGAICRWVNEGTCPHTSHVDSPVQLQIGHGISGNPMRFESGPTRVVNDEEWRSAMPRLSRLLVTAVTLPSLIHSRYIPRTTEGDRTDP